MSTGFNVKITPKPKEESSFKNFYFWGANPKLEEFNNRIVYINSEYAGKHIYNPYFVENGIACVLTVHKEGQQAKRPVVTLQDLGFDDVILHFTQEEWDKYLESKKKTDKKP